MCFAIFPFHLFKVLRLLRKSDARSYGVLHLSRKLILANPTDLMLQNATPLRKSAPGPPNSSDEHISCLHCACHGKCLFADPLQMPHACHRFWKCDETLTFCSLLTRYAIRCACHAKRRFNAQKWRVHGMFCTFKLRHMLRATTVCIFSTSQLPKVVRTCGVLCSFTWTCASRRNSVHFFDTSTSKSAPKPGCFAHFDLEMYLAPQRRATFHLSSHHMAPRPPL